MEDISVNTPRISKSEEKLADAHTGIQDIKKRRRHKL